MMAIAAVTGFSAGKRLPSCSFRPTNRARKLFPSTDHGSLPLPAASIKLVIVVQKSSHFGPNVPSARHKQSTKVLILLQKSTLAKQWDLTSTQMMTVATPGRSCQMPEITHSGISARQRRMITRRKRFSHMANRVPASRVKQVCPSVSPELLKSNVSGYVRGIFSEKLLTDAEVITLSKKIKAGIQFEEHRSKLKEELGFEPTDNELASSLRMSRAELHTKMIECSLAREKLAKNNLRLVMSIAQKYENSGVEMADLIQGGLIGLLRGIEKFDYSKGYRISTYVYWWIRQGVSRALFKNSSILRLPIHMHERLNSVRRAKIRLKEKGITPSIEKIAESLNMSEEKVRNAMQAASRVLSLDREALHSLNGLPGERLHSYIVDTDLENNPWHCVQERSLKDEVNKLLHTTLSNREREIIGLYHGIGNKCHTWEDIGKKFGLSRECVRQVGLVAMEKLKHGARRRRLDAMLVKD